jgi:hypothetical protein
MLAGLKYGRGWLIATPFVERAVKEPSDVLRNGREKALHRPLGDNNWVQPIVGHPAQADPGVITKKLGHRKTCDKVLIGSF